MFSTKAQGTIEYLVIVAIVVVISLVVVALFSESIGTSVSSIGTSSTAVSSASGIISVADATIDPTGAGIISLQNNDVNPITVTQLTIGSTDTNFADQVFGGSKVLFSVNALLGSCLCAQGETKKTCTINVHYVTQEGIPKNMIVMTNVACVPEIIPIEPEKVIGFEKGTLNQPWKLKSCADVQDMNKHLDGNYVLQNNIDCSDTKNWNGGAGFLPIGNVTTPFVGSLDGKGHTITGLYIYAPTEVEVGLFGYSFGDISHIGLVDVNVFGRGGLWEGVGGLVGYQADGLITKSFVTGMVTGTYNSVSIGGLVGWQEGGSISNSYATGTMTGTSSVGGLVGSQDGGSISNSYATATIKGTLPGGSSDLGSFVGYQSGGSISNSFGVGSVTGISFIAGFISGQYGTITNSYWDMTRTGYAVCCNNPYGPACSDTCIGKNAGNADPNTFFPQGALGNDYNVPMQHNTDAGNNWDFTSIWQKNTNDYPTLR